MDVPFFNLSLGKSDQACLTFHMVVEPCAAYAALTVSTNHCQSSCYGNTTLATQNFDLPLWSLAEFFKHSIKSQPEVRFAFFSYQPSSYSYLLSSPKISSGPVQEPNRERLQTDGSEVKNMIPAQVLSCLSPAVLERWGDLGSRCSSPGRNPCALRGETTSQLLNGLCTSRWLK